MAAPGACAPGHGGWRGGGVGGSRPCPGAGLRRGPSRVGLPFAERPAGVDSPPARPLLRAAASARGNLGPALRTRGAGGGGTAAAPRRRGAGGTDPGLWAAAPPGRTPGNALWGRRVGWGRPALQLELLPLVKNTPCPVLSLPIPRGALPPGPQPSPPRLALAPPRGQLCLLLICPLAQLARRLRREGRGDTVSERDSLRRCPRDKGVQRGSGVGARGGGREGAEGGREEGGGAAGGGRGGALFLVGPCP